MEQKRIDVMLVERGLAPSRENAKRLIESGRVTVNGKVLTKPSKTVDADALIAAERERYVSRGGYKLEKAIEGFKINVKGMSFMDCGASTGGFTDCLLQHGAEKVWAVDVGTSQLQEKLLNDERVVSIENTNIRYIDKYDWMESLGGVVMDVSFISAELVLKRLFEVVSDKAFYIVLIKPQFEAGKEHLNKNGIVNDKKVHASVIRRIADFALLYGYTATKLTYSPITGGDGNVEYLIYFDKSDKNVYNINDKIIDGVVRQAFDALRKGV